ncbi:hypothetical protein [Plantactinospora sp. WMMB782]|uniref:hypothetical protein n=1 Tax=Plantactinospora sp. WMMB782 TaxID=3404121 RepID=UPI003B92C876
MIVGSLVLILAAVALLVLGLASGSSGLLIGSIAVSLLAAVALVVGARQAAGARGVASGFAPDGPGDDGFTTRAGEATEPRRRRPPTSARRAPTDPRLAEAGPAGPIPGSGPVLTEPVEATVPAQASRPGTDDDTGWRQPAGGSEAPAADPGGPGEPDDDVPADEPAAQPVSEAEAALVAALLDDVYVVDGRPRYHLVDCAHLSGRESEPLPVSEAVELGFTPCGRCEPDTALLTDAHRR